ncbi:EF_hand domain-containing protein [Hexamita inflata]|uniref:EF hand domain-containing protein n=1 Tax=Hexamita inflata TaxID=28002 RepID=A0AA86QK60_9EUKA|nr:EF hand domain-containing protein [Hexamita inflata]
MHSNIYRYQEMFDELDYRGYNYLTLDQIIEAVNQQTNKYFDKNIAQQLMLTADFHDENMSLDQFCQFMYICENADYNDSVSILFYAADLNQSGYLDKQQVQKIVKKLKLGLVFKEVSSLVEMYADSYDGTVGYTVYKQIVKQLQNTQNELNRKQQLRDNYVEPENTQNSNIANEQQQQIASLPVKNKTKTSKQLKINSVDVFFI